jgi:hypothetical protein
MFCDIYLSTLCYYICCLLGACMRCTWLCPLKPGVTAAAEAACLAELMLKFMKKLKISCAKHGH